MIPSATAQSERYPALDGLRGLAIMFVLIHHFGIHLPGWLDWGPVAPNIFFLLSGYLITRSLMKMQKSPQSGQLFSYHARRLTRLLPALYIMLGVGWLVGLEEFRENLPWHASFASNIHMVIKDDWDGYASHLWSLSVQEQFYLVWPLILFLPKRWMVPALLGTFVGAALFRLWCLQVDASDLFRWLMLPASLDIFAAGGLIACLGVVRKDAPLIPPRWRIPASVFALGCWFFARNLRGGYGTNHASLAFIDTFETIFFAWLLIELLQTRNTILVRIFSFTPLTLIGRISYGMYLWHMLVLLALAPTLDSLGFTVKEHPFVRCVVLTLATMLIAWASWIALERPFIEWGRRLAAPHGHLMSLRSRIARFFRRAENA